jgi:hypothetical protein
MTEVEIPEGSGNFYKYRWNPESKQMDYLGPKGDAPSISQEDFRVALIMGTLHLETIDKSINPVRLKDEFDKAYFGDVLISGQFHGPIHEHIPDLPESEEEGDFVDAIVIEFRNQMDKLFEMNPNKKLSVQEASVILLDEGVQTVVLQEVAISNRDIFNELGYDNTLKMIEIIGETTAFNFTNPEMVEEYREMKKRRLTQKSIFHFKQKEGIE